jgi:putative membrane protein
MKGSAMRLIIRAVVLLLGTVALALVGPAAMAEASTGSSVSSGVTAQDRAFLRAAHQSNLAEITTGKLAQQKSPSADVRRLGREWVMHHTMLDASLKQVAKRYGVSLPTRPNAEQRAQAAKDARLSGAAFDRTWLSGELTGHVKARTAGRTELARGSNAAVLKLDRTAAPVVQHHINEIVAAQHRR